MYIYSLINVCICSVIRHDINHEDQGLICNNACPVMFSKALNDLNTAKLLTELHVLSDWHSIKHDATYTASIKLYLQSMLECTKHVGIDYLPKTNNVENGL